MPRCRCQEVDEHGLFDAPFTVVGPGPLYRGGGPGTVAGASSARDGPLWTCDCRSRPTHSSNYKTTPATSRWLRASPGVATQGSLSAYGSASGVDGARLQVNTQFKNPTTTLVGHHLMVQTARLVNAGTTTNTRTVGGSAHQPCYSPIGLSGKARDTQPESGPTDADAPACAPVPGDPCRARSRPATRPHFSGVLLTPDMTEPGDLARLPLDCPLIQVKPSISWSLACSRSNSSNFSMSGGRARRPW
jgi:hypothetical protein